MHEHQSSLWFAAAAVLLCCLGLPAYFAYDTARIDRAEAAMTPVAGAYLDALVADDRAAGYALLCRDRRDQVTLERWSAATNTQPSVTGYRIVRARVVPGNEGVDSYFVDLDLHYSDGSRREIALEMADERDGWKVCTSSAY